MIFTSVTGRKFQTLVPVSSHDSKNVSQNSMQYFIASSLLDNRTVQ